ncbi:hypothetical protein WA577_005498, partial [Blastocystis sp. JDR]
MAQKKNEGFEEILQAKNEEIARLKEKAAPSFLSEAEGELGAALEESLDASLDASLAEESLLEVDEEDKAKLESLAEQETRINTLLQSKKQMQSLKEKYENKILQIASQLELLTKENAALQQQLKEAEKKAGASSGSATARTLQELRRKLKKNEATAQQLQKWRGEYNQIIAKYRLKEVEVRELQSTLKQVRAERIRFQKDVAKKAREVQLEQRRRELEEKRQRLRDHKEQEALEKQI